MTLSINISRELFLDALSSLQNVTNKRGTMPILANVLLTTGVDSLLLTGNDLEVGIQTNCAAQVQAEGSITLPSRKLFEIVRETVSDFILLEQTENNWVRIQAGSSNYNLAGMASDDFPAFPEFQTDILHEFSAELLRDLIDRTFFAIANESETMYCLTSALFDKDQDEEGKTLLRMVTSDSHRLALMEHSANGDFSKMVLTKKTLIPKKGVQEIRKFCENHNTVFFGFDEKQAILKTDNSILIIRLMEGDFPQYSGIAKNVDKDLNIVLDRVVFLNSMKRMNIFTEDRFNVVKIDIDNQKLTLTSQNADIGNAKDEIDITYKGVPFSIYFNGKYFVDALQVLESKTVNIFIASSKSPCILTSEEHPGFLNVIMPMKL